MSSLKQMSPELLDALKAAGFTIREEEQELTSQEKVERVKELEVLLNQAKEEKNEAVQKKIRRQQRKLMGGPWRRQFTKLSLPEADTQ